MRQEFANKRVGEFFALTDGCSLTLDAVRHRDEYDDPLDLTRLLHYTFDIEATLYCYRFGAEPVERALRLVYRFSDVASESVRFRDAENGREYDLSVSFIGVPSDKHGHVPRDARLSVSFLLQEAARTGLSSLSLGGEEDNHMDVEPPPQRVERIFLLAVHHDDTEELIEEQLPRILHHIERRAQQQGRRSALSELVVLWESENFADRRPLLRPAVTGRFSLALEGDLYSQMQPMLSAYLLYRLGEVEGRQYARLQAVKLRERILGWHGYTKEDVESYETHYGEEGVCIRITISIVVSYLRIMMNLGRAQSLVAFRVLFGSDERTLMVAKKMAHLFVNVVLTKAHREILEKVRTEYYASGEREDKKWYFSRFFLNYARDRDVDATDHHHIKGRHASFRKLLHGMVRLLIRGPDQADGGESVDVARLWRQPRYESLDPAKLTREHLQTSLEQLGEWSTRHEWVVDEYYFAEVNRLVFRLYGHIGSALFLLLEEAVSRRKRLLQLGHLVTQYRNVQSVLHTMHVMRTTHCRDAVLVVGQDHVEPLRGLFRGVGVNSLAWYNTFKQTTPLELTIKSKRTRRKFAAQLRAQLAMEALDQWIFGAPGTQSSIDREASLQLYFFLQDADALNPAHFATRLPSLLQLMRLYAWLFWTRDAYHGDPLVWPDWSIDTAEARQFLVERRYPPVLVEIMLCTRDLVQSNPEARWPGSVQSGELGYLQREMGDEFLQYMKEAGILSGAWTASMVQADRDRPRDTRVKQAPKVIIYSQ